MFKLLRKNLKGIALFFAVLAPCLMVVEVVMDLMQPTLLKDIINTGVGNGDLDYVLNIGIKMIACAIIGVIGGMSCSIAASIAGNSFGEKIRERLFNKIQSLSFSEIDKFKTSSLITRLTNDTNQLQNITIMALKMIIRSPLMCIGGIVMACRISMDLSVVIWL